MLTASIYQLTKRNALVTDPLTSISTQTGEVRSRGIEFEGKVNLDESWKLIAGLDFMDIEVTEDANRALIGKSPYLVPDTQASLWLDYTVQQGALEGLSLGAGVRYRGELGGQGKYREGAGVDRLRRSPALREGRLGRYPQCHQPVRQALCQRLQWPACLRIWRCAYGHVEAQQDLVRSFG